MIKYIHIVLAIWLFAVVVPVGFAESFSGRPTETEMGELVTLGTESGHGVYERCYATQYTPSPAYYVSPPSFIGTNGWYLSTSVMQSLDDKAKTLVSHYVDSTTWAPDMGSFGSPLTVTGLWSKLDIGDGVNQFTGTPAIGTNPPTYGDYPWRPYPESLEERYVVLNALKWTVDNYRQVTNQSWYGMISYWGDVQDPWIYAYSNKTTYAITKTYSPSWEAIDLGKQDDWSVYTKIYPDGQYKPDTNQVVMQGSHPDYNTNWFLTWNQVKSDLIEDTLWGYGDWDGGFVGETPLWGDYTGWVGPYWGASSNSVYTRYHEWIERRTNSLSSATVKPGTFAWAYKCPYSIYTWNLSGTNTIWNIEGWDWSFCYYTGYATWKWYNNITNGINNTLIGVFAIGGFQQPQPSPWFQPVGVTEDYHYDSYMDWLVDMIAHWSDPYFDDYWSYPREWQIDKESPWSELAGLASTNYVKLDVSTAGDWLYMEFGAGQAPVASLGSMPPHPAEPLTGNAFWDNTGSKGTAKGILVNDAYIVRDWDFNYCTDE